MRITGASYVPPAGELDAPFIVVGDQPGRMEVTSNQPFVGMSGKLLFECMNVANIIRSECYLTNVIKDLEQKLDKYFVYEKGKVKVQQNWYKYVEILHEELLDTTGLIIAIGNASLFALTGCVGIQKWRGSVLESTLLPGRKVIPILHPGSVLPPKNQYLNKILIQFDLNRARNYVDGKWQASNYDIKIQPSFHEAMEWLEKCYQDGLKGYTVDYDIECRYEQVSCFSITSNSWEVMSIPFVHGAGDYFTIDQEIEIWRAFAKILQEVKIKKRGQNLIFDSAFLMRKNKILTKNIDDTMVAQQIIMHEFPRGLDFITSMWTTHPYYKDDGKKYFEGGNWPRLWTYNGTDSMITAEAFPKQWEELRNQGNIETYKRQVALLEPLTYMMERGIKADMVGINRVAAEMTKEIEDLTRAFQAYVGFELNPNSSTQLQKYFYGSLGHKPYKSRSTGNISVDALALSRLAAKGVKEASMIKAIRKLGKVRSNYLEPDKYDKDGRIRCSYNPVGTAWSRLSSSENIFGTGMNMQNWPHHVLKYLKCDDGYIYFSFDLAQAENRFVAYLGKIHQMIKAFEEWKDVHSMTGGLIFDKPASEVSDEPGSSTLGNGEHSERDWGKRSNHGLNYDFSAQGFSLLYEMALRQAKFIVEKYHKIYPGVRQGFHAMIKRCLRESRTLTNPFGRKTLFLDKLDDKTFKNAYACIPQGTVGDIINEWGMDHIYKRQDLYGHLELLTQVHDSIGFQIPLKVGWKAMAEMLFSIKASLEQTMQIHQYEFFIPADLMMGLNLDKSRGHDIKAKQFPDDVQGLADLIEKQYYILREAEDKLLCQED